MYPTGQLTRVYSSEETSRSQSPTMGQAAGLVRSPHPRFRFGHSPVRVCARERVCVYVRLRVCVFVCACLCVCLFACVCVHERFHGVVFETLGVVGQCCACLHARLRVRACTCACGCVQHSPPFGHNLHAEVPALIVRYVRMGHVQLSKLVIPSRPPVSAPEGHAPQLANAVAPASSL